MKILYLVRHAKAAGGHSALRDFDRRLADRGLRDAPMMGRIIASTGDAPQTILSSTALRAITTARLLASAMGLPEAAVAGDSGLYGASAAGILEAVLGLDHAVDRAMLVGHNPGMTQLAAELSRGAVDHLPTCAIAAFEFRADRWDRVRPGLAKLRFFETPKRRAR